MNLFKSLIFVCLLSPFSVPPMVWRHLVLRISAKILWGDVAKERLRAQFPDPETGNVVLIN